MTAATDKSTILVVDDTPANLSLLGEVLKSDYRTKAAVSGEKALKIAFSDTPPDLILLDIMMPGMDGYEVCRTAEGESGDTRHPGHLRDVDERGRGRNPRPRGRRRRLRHEADQRADRQGAGEDTPGGVLPRPGNATVDREAGGAGRRACGMEPHPRTSSGGRDQGSRKAGTSEAVFLAIGRGSPPVGLRRRPVEESPARNCRRIHRPARLHRVHRDVGPRRRHGRHRRVSRRDGPAGRGARRHSRAIRRGRHHDLLQRSGRGRQSRRHGGEDGDRHAGTFAALVQGWQKRGYAIWRWESASRRDSPRSARSGSKDAATTARSGP